MRRAVAAVLLSCLVIVPVAPSPARAATGRTALFMSTTEGSGPTRLETFTLPDATFAVDWNGVQLIVDVDTPAHQSHHTIYIAPPSGDALAPGTYTAVDSLDLEGPSGPGCTKSVTIDSIDPVPQPGVAVPLASFVELSASFSMTCGGSVRAGELRFHADEPFSAVGLASDPLPQAGLSMSADPTFAGRRSAATSLTLRNRGTEPLALGARTLDAGGQRRWQITSDTCAGATLAPGEDCTIAGTAMDWVPGRYEDGEALDVSIGAGSVHMALNSMATAATFVPIDPVRLVDTRIGLGVSSALRHRVARVFTVVDRNPGVPATNIPPEAVAVVGNLTLTGQSSAGYAALTDVATNAPSISTLNIPKGDIRANGTITRLSPSGTLGLTWVGGTGSHADAVFDATGYFVPISGLDAPLHGNFRSMPPTRMLDSRTGLGFAGKLLPGVPRSFEVTLPAGHASATAVAGNLTVVSPTGAGYLTIGPTPVTTPTTSTVNFPKGDTRANNVVMRMDGAKTLSITYVGQAGTSVDVVFDATGTFGSGTAGYMPLVPNRIVDSRIGKGLASAVPGQKVRLATVEGRAQAEASKNVPPFTVVLQDGVTGNVTIVSPTKSGHVSVAADGAPTPPPTSTINFPPGDVRANGVVVASVNVYPIKLQFWYGAALTAKTHVVFDITGYFTR